MHGKKATVNLDESTKQNYPCQLKEKLNLPQQGKTKGICNHQASTTEDI
jgi:hypothetical protein